MPRAPQRPGAVLAVAIILFLAGGLGFVGSICGGGSIAMLEALPDMKGKGAEDPLAMHRFVSKEVPGYAAFLYGSLALGLLLAIVNIVLGVGILRLSPAARIVTMLVVLFDLLRMTLGVVYNLVFVFPAQSRFVDANPGPEHAMAIPMAIAMLVLAIIINLAVAATILILLNTASAKAAFAAAGQPPSEEEEEGPRSRYRGYEDDDDRPLSSGETGITDRPM